MVVAACMLFSNTANAQFGISVGHTTQRIESSLDGSVSYGGDCPVRLPIMMRGFFVGVDYNKSISDDLGFSVGLQFRRNSDVDDEGIFGETKYDQILFDIPVLFNYGYKITDKLKISAFVGATLSLATDGSTIARDNDFFQSWYDGNNLQSFDVAATIGLSVQYYHYRLFLGYNHGLLDLGKDNSSNTFDVKVRYTNIGISYVF